MAVDRWIHGAERHSAIVLHHLHLDGGNIVVRLSGLVGYHFHVVSEGRFGVNAAVDSPDLHLLSGGHFASPVEGITRIGPQASQVQTTRREP